MLIKNLKLSSIIILGLSLSGCQTTGDLAKNQTINALDGLNGSSIQVKKRNLTAAEEAIKSGKINEAEKFYERLYVKNSKDTDVALNYSQILRHTGQNQKALMVISPLANTNKASSEVLLEYASVNTQLGNFDKAERSINKILKTRKASEYHPRAINLKGIIKDANGKPAEAEILYREALDIWDGDPTSVMNNLALSLAQQGMFDESLSTLRKALIMNPNEKKIAKNITIVSDLRNNIIKKPK